MKTIKFVVWLILLSVLGIAIYQNRETLSMNLPFSLNLYFRPEVRWSYPVGNVMGFSALAGFILGSWMFFKLYWRKRKELKQCVNSLKELSLTASGNLEGEKSETRDSQPVSSSGDV